MIEGSQVKPGTSLPNLMSNCAHHRKVEYEQSVLFSAPQTASWLWGVQTNSVYQLIILSFLTHSLLHFPFLKRRGERKKQTKFMECQVDQDSAWVESLQQWLTQIWQPLWIWACLIQVRRQPRRSEEKVLHRNRSSNSSNSMHIISLLRFPRQVSLPLLPLLCQDQVQPQPQHC